jgi:hypothetical protein
MYDKIIDQEEEILSIDVSDETLEAAGTKDRVAAYTLMACTGLSDCVQ